MISSIDHVQLAIPTGGEPAARQFWVELMGLFEVAKPPTMAARGGAWFATEPAPPGTPPGVGPTMTTGLQVHVGAEVGFVPARKAHPAFKTPNADALADRLVSAGLPVRWDDEIPGVRRFHTEDPFGNRIEIIST